MAKLNLLEALAAVTEDDLTEIDRQLAELQKKVDALKVARAVVDAQLHGPKQRAARGTGKAAKAAAASATEPTDEPDSVGEKIYELLRDEGGMTVSSVAATLKISPSQVYYHAKQDGRFALVAGLLQVKK